MGEKSKKRGEFGEDIVEQLLKSIGWESSLKGRDFPCVRPIDHSASTRGRITHGIDFIFRYDCPLFNNMQEFVLISSKFNDEYPSNPVSKFKSHLQDLAQALECFKKSSIRNQLRAAGKDTKYTGVIFWIDNGKNSYDDVIDRLNEFKIDNDLEFDSIYLVDNRRAEFLHNSLVFANNYFREAKLEFYIPNIGYNDVIQTRQTSSSLLPVQYINSSVLPLKVIQNQTTEILILNIIDDFEEDFLIRLISLAQHLTEGWANKIYILFPEFNNDLHGEIVENVKLNFSDQSFVRKIEVDTFMRGFRNV